MKTVLYIIITLLVLIVIGTVLFMRKGPDLSQYEGLREPAFVTLPDQKMLVVEAKGDPNVVGKKAFGMLIKAYFKVKETPKGKRMPTLHARWPRMLETPKSEWVGYYGMPIPESVTSVPALKGGSGLTVGLTTWEYGQVAEILHVGPYGKEEPTVAKLVSFINENGFEIIGDHEEEYLRGPGMFSKGNPEKYYTIIRYRVQQRDTTNTEG
jgi:effector-binding domain-containing protein